MTTKQWAARAVLAATMAAGLSACGGGGDSAATAATPTPEVLKAGLTIKESSISQMNTGLYQMTLIIDGITDTGPTIEYIATSQYPMPYFLAVSYDKTSKKVTKAALQTQPELSFVQAGCGFSSFECNNSHITIDPINGHVSVSSLVLKELSSPGSKNLIELMANQKTGVTKPAGTLVVSGSLKLTQ